MVALAEFNSYLKSLLKDSSNNNLKTNYYVSSFADLKLQIRTTESGKSNRIEHSTKIEKYLVLEGLKKYASEQILLIGKPGSGKTTALLELQLREAKRCLKVIDRNNDETPQIPVLIELRSLKGSVLTSIKEKLEWWIELDEEFVKKLIRDRKLLILLDGLNELSNSSILQEVEEFRQISKRFKTSLIISTRELGSALIRGDFKKLEMLPLNEAQMRDFVKKRLPETGDELLQQLQGRIKELAQTPLLLQMLCEVFDEREELPKNKGDLFRKEFARRYEKFKPTRLRTVSEDSRRFAFEFLCYLAFRMVRGDAHINSCKPTSSWVTISKIKAETILAEFLSSESDPKAKAKEWLEDLLEWHLLQVASKLNCIEFHHQLFQEYYAGEYLALQLGKLSDEQLQQSYLNYLKWTESIAMAMSFIESETLAKRITKLALDVDLKLGAELAGSVNCNFQNRTASIIYEQDIPDRFKIYLLGETKSSVVIDELIKMMNHQDAKTRRVVVWALRNLNLNAAMPVLELAIRDSEPQVRNTAIRVIGLLDIEKAVSFVVPFLQKELEAYVRGTAVICILSESESKLAILELLRLTQDEDHNVRGMADYGLETRNRQKVLYLFTRFLRDKNNNLSLRMSAAEQLGKLGNKNTILTLSETILNADASSEMVAIASMSRVEIIRRINNNRKLEKENREQQKHDLIKHWLQYIDAKESIRRGNAVMNLSRLLEKNEAIKLVRKYLNDSHHYVRGHAISSLTTLIGEKAVPEIIEILNNPHYDLVSKEASQALVWLKESLPNNFEISKSVITKLIQNLNEDRNRSVSTSAAQTIHDLCSVSSSLKNNQDLKTALLNTSFCFDRYLRSKVAQCLGNFSDRKAIERLLQLLEDTDSYVSLYATEAIKNINPQIISKFLPNLKNLVNNSEKCLGLDSMLSIQSRCGFYNYEIAQLTKIQLPISKKKIPNLLYTINQATQETNQQIKQMVDKPNVRNIRINKGNYNENIQGDYIDNSRKIDNSGTINNSGAGAFNLGEISGTLANTINQLPKFDTEPDKQQLKQLLSRLPKIVLEAELDEEEKEETLEQVAEIAKALQNSQDGAMKKTAKRAMKMLRGTAAALPPSAALVTICNQLPDLISKIF